MINHTSTHEVVLTAKQLVHSNIPNETPVSRTARELARRIELIQRIALSLMIIFGLTIVALWLQNGTWFTITRISVELVAGCALFATSYSFVRFQPNMQKATVAASILIATLVLMLFALNLANDDSNNMRVIEAAFVVPCLLVGIIGLSSRGIFVVAGLSYLALIVSDLFIANDIFDPQVHIEALSPVYFFLWAMLFLLVSTTIYIFAQRFIHNNHELEDQTDRLRELLTALNNSTEFGINLSRELAQVTAELNQTSHEHARSTQEQVASVTEVTTSMEELNETANQIALAASLATELTDHTVTVATQVRDSSALAQSSAEHGALAVVEAVMSVAKVRNRIELLGQRLTVLTEQTSQVDNIINIIDDIADETHLLALNASIEAAGGNTDDPVYNRIRGERFGVIAQEIKGLADRSRQSTKEVRSSIQDMQRAVILAVQVAEEGKQETSAALSRSQTAGGVIDKLNEAVMSSAERAEEILQAVEEVKIRCDEIRVATSQQRSANQQILATMRSVNEVSQESFGAVSQLSETVMRVNQQLDQLNVVLTHSNDTMLASAA